MILFFKVLINLTAKTDFLSLCVEYISISLSFNHDFIDGLQNSLHLSTYILSGVSQTHSKLFED